MVDMIALDGATLQALVLVCDLLIRGQRAAAEGTRKGGQKPSPSPNEGGTHGRATGPGAGGARTRARAERTDPFDEFDAGSLGERDR